MWFAILTPGAHPSCPDAGSEATIFAWTPEDRRSVQGPFAAVHGGLRVTRRKFHDEGLEARPPRCFLCLRGARLPDVDALRREVEPPPQPSGSRAAPRAIAPARALLAWVHLADLHGPDETPLDEEALVVVPGTTLALFTELDCIPRTLELVGQAVGDAPPPRCTRCDAVLPGSKGQRALDELQRARRTAGRSRAARRRAA